NVVELTFARVKLCSVRFCPVLPTSFLEVTTSVPGLFGGGGLLGGGLGELDADPPLTAVSPPPPQALRANIATKTHSLCEESALWGMAGCFRPQTWTCQQHPCRASGSLAGCLRGRRSDPLCCGAAQFFWGWLKL